MKDKEKDEPLFVVPELKEKPLLTAAQLLRTAVTSPMKYTSVNTATGSTMTTEMPMRYRQFGNEITPDPRLSVTPLTPSGRTVDHEAQSSQKVGAEDTTGGARNIISSPGFKLILLSTVGLLVLSVGLVTIVGLAAADPMTEGQKRLMDIFQHLIGLGAGALFGLLGGKVA